MNYLDIKNPVALQAAVSTSLLDNATVRYYADYQVDAASMVAAIVPTANRTAMESSEWLRKVVTSYGTAELPGFDLLDPVYIVEREGLTDPAVFNLDEIPTPAPTFTYCRVCQDWDVSQARFGIETVHPTKSVLPVRFVYGARIVELLLCGDCVRALGVEPS